MDVIGLDGKGFYLRCNNNQKKHEISVTIPSANFNAGKHMISFFALAPDMSKTYCRADNVAVLNFGAFFPTGAILIQPSKWTIHNT